MYKLFSWIRGSLRLLYFLLATVYRVGVLLLHHLIWPNDEIGIMKSRQRYVRNLCWVMGFHIHKHGELPTGHGIVMGNHRSYFDPAIVVYDVFGWPVSKAEVEKWPIIGFGAKLTGVVFVQRENRKSRAETLSAIKSKIDEGWLVFLFPEGTTKGEALTTEFRIGGFNLAATNGYPIWPIAVEYGDRDNYWIDNESFVPHLFRQLCRPTLEMHIWYGPAMTGTDGKALMERCRGWIDERLEEFRQKK